MAARGEAPAAGAGTARTPEPRTSCRAPKSRMLWALLLVGAVALSFGASYDGELIWDDVLLVKVARRADVLSTDLFGLGEKAAAGVGASYWRPLTLLTFRLEQLLWPHAPERALHLSNLLWHALAALLVARALARWSGASSGADRPACWLAAALWALLPLKAENVAWISGRGDALGLALLLGGLELRRLVRRSWLGTAAVAVATCAALLSKEGFVCAFILVAVEVNAESLAETTRSQRLWRALVSRPVIASSVVVAIYLALRFAIIPVRGGGAAMFSGLSVGDRLALFLETVGHALRALLLPHDAYLLRGPIGFAAPFVLQRQPAMAALGAGGIIALAALGWRVKAVRPAAALLAVTLLPVVNLVPTGLESRMSDRFLYTPSLALALALAVALQILARRAPRWRTPALLAVGATAAFMMIAARARSRRFRSRDALWSWEQAHGDGAATVLVRAGNAALRARRYRQARDLRVRTASRYAELGFAEGFPYALQAARLQVMMTGELHARSLRAYGRALAALVEGWDERVAVPFPDGGGVVLATGTAEARGYARRQSLRLQLRLLLLAARRGAAGAGPVAEQLAAARPADVGLRLDAARVLLALASPERALALLRSAARSVVAAELERSAQLQLRCRSRAVALFVGEAYPPACKRGVRALTEATPPGERRIIALACVLAGRRRLLPAREDSAQLQREAMAWRLDRSRRERLVTSALR